MHTARSRCADRFLENVCQGRSGCLVDVDTSKVVSKVEPAQSTCVEVLSSRQHAEQCNKVD